VICKLRKAPEIQFANKEKVISGEKEPERKQKQAGLRLRPTSRIYELM
jgi:hypothetical protein